MDAAISASNIPHMDSATPTRRMSYDHATVFSSCSFNPLYLTTESRSRPSMCGLLDLQVDRLKPRFRQFILDGCTEPQGSGRGVQNTPNRGFAPDVHTNWSSTRRAQDLEAARKSLAFEADENAVRPASRNVDVAQAKEDTLPTPSDRLQDIRRRMGGLGSREPGVGATRTGAARVEGHINLAAQGRTNMDR